MREEVKTNFSRYQQNKRKKIQLPFNKMQSFSQNSKTSWKVNNFLKHFTNYTCAKILWMKVTYCKVCIDEKKCKKLITNSMFARWSILEQIGWGWGGGGILYTICFITRFREPFSDNYSWFCFNLMLLKFWRMALLAICFSF